MAPPRTRLTDAEWNQHKLHIRRMIIDQNMSQEEARQRLKDDGVLVTKAQLEYKLKIWGFRKKAPKEKSDVIWQFIGHRIEKRQRQQKASDVLLNGQLVDPVKVRKEINRHQPKSLVRFQQAGVGPKTPESTEIIIRTPASTPMQFAWPSCLPWFQFQRNLPFWMASFHTSEAPHHVPIKSVTKRKTTFLNYFSRFTGDSVTNNISCLAASLDIFMPEACQDENRCRAELLLRGSAKDVLAEHVNVVFYQVSNKLITLNTEIHNNKWFSIFALLEESGITKMPLQLGKTTNTTLLSVAETLFQESFHRLREEYRYNYWYEGFVKEQNVDRGLESYEDAYNPAYETWNEGWRVSWNAEMLQKLPSWRIISWLLACGQDPNTPIPFREERERFTPLQVAADMACSHLVFLLLDAKSDPTLVFDVPRPFIATFLQRSYRCADKVRLLKRLLAHSACLSLFEGENRASLLEDAIDGLSSPFDDSQRELLDILIDNETERLTKYRSYCPYKWVTDTMSVLGSAAMLEDESMAVDCLSHLLGRISQSNPGLLPAQFITPDVTLLAAWQGNDKVIELLQKFDVDLTLCGHRGITALHVAACQGHLKICQRLLELDFPVNGHADSQNIPSPLQFAVWNNEFEVMQLLHDHGAQLIQSITQEEKSYWSECIYELEYEDENVTSPFVQQGVVCPPSAAYCEASRPCPRRQVVQSALRMGADPNWTGENGFSALQVALQQQDDMSITMKVETAMQLLDAGAVLNGGEISNAALLGDWTLINRLIEIHLSGIRQRHESVSVLEVAIASGSQCLITQTLTQHPGTYDAGVLCSSVFFEDNSFSTVKYLLDIRPHMHHMLPLESLAIGLAAWRDHADLLDLLLAKFRKPSIATLPNSLVQSLRHCTRYFNEVIETARRQKKLFWREGSQILTSPLTLALMSKTSLSRLLNHGFLPDRLTMSIAVSIGHDGPVRNLSGYPMLSPGFEHFEGPLAVAVRRNDIDSVKYLLDGYYCVNEDNSLITRGRSPLQMAVERGYLRITKLLLSAGADVNAPAALFRGATALQLATMKGCLGVAKMLVDHGADVNAPAAADEGGRTALEGAAEYGRVDTIQYLLSQGVETNANGRLSYLRAIRYAEQEGHMVAAKLIKMWREWTAKDDALWDELKFLSKYECEHFIEEDFDHQSDSESRLERASPGKDNAGDGMQDVVFDDAPAAEAHTHAISVTSNPAVDTISELEDLEMMMTDTFAFWSGL